MLLGTEKRKSGDKLNLQMKINYESWKGNCLLQLRATIVYLFLYLNKVR